MSDAMAKYKERQEAIKNLIKGIQALLRKDAKEAKADPHWGHAGSLGYVVEQLREVRDFLSGGTGSDDKPETDRNQAELPENIEFQVHVTCRVTSTDPNERINRPVAQNAVMQAISNALNKAMGEGFVHDYTDYLSIEIADVRPDGDEAKREGD